LGGRGEVAELPLPPLIAVHWAADGDHDFTPRGRKGAQKPDSLSEAADAVAAFVAMIGGAASVSSCHR
jgi:predicted alpha/beta-hydrolase family hydrolase